MAANRTIATAILLLTTLPYSGGFAQTDTPQPSDIASSRFVWLSSSDNAPDFAEELTRFYLSLFNTKRLSLRFISLEKPLSLDEVLRQNNLIIGPKVPLGVESLICDLNRTLCDRDRSVSLKTGTISNALSSTIQGVPPSPIKSWSVAPGSLVVIPEVRIERLSKWIIFDKDDTESVADIVVNSLGGCDQFDENCRRNILLNNSVKIDFADPQWTGPLSLPVIAARAWVDTRIAAPSSIQSSTPGGAPTSALAPTPGTGDYKGLPNWSVNRSIGKYVDNPATNSKAVIDQFRFNVPSALQGRLYSIEEDTADDNVSLVVPKDFEAQRELIVKLTDFPYGTLGAYPATVQGGNIAVLDGWIDKAHCALSSQAIEVQNDGDPAETQTERNCNETQKADEDKDHGTHVLGIIASRTSDGAEFGLNPFAHVITKQVDFSSLNASDFNAQQRLVDLAQFIATVHAQHNVTIVNMSWGYVKTTPGPDPLETAIAGDRYSVLFVVAAGNQGVDTTSICDVRPACFDFPNVISVGALSNNLETTHFLTRNNSTISNYGQRVDIVAPGEDVLSTIRFGRFGKLSGTSQAAPVVTAVASMLQAELQLSPIEIKNRLIYCSDLRPGVSNKLFGGVLNAECTLNNYLQGQLILTTDPDGSAPRVGKFVSGSTIRFKNVDTSRVAEVGIEDIRGIQYDQRTKTSAIFYNEAPARLESRLLKEERVKFVAGGDSATFIDSKGNSSELPLDKIRKYVSAAK
jgi:subtilisin family serine protease